MKTKIYQKWISAFAVTAVTVLIIIGVVNFLVDPLWIFNNNGSWNTYKLGFNERQQKTNYLPNIINEINGLVIGSSMSRLLSTHDFESLKVFNYACSSLYPDDAAEFISHAISLKKLKLLVFIGIDIWNVIPPEKKDYQETSMYIQKSIIKYGSLFSIDSLKWSIKILEENLFSSRSTCDYIFEKGYPMAISTTNLVGEKLLKDVNESVKRHLQNYKNYTTIFWEKLKNKMDSLGIVPIIFVTPVTKIYLKKMIEIGAYPMYERFIRDSVGIFGSVWNFMYVNSVTDGNRFFYDSNHTNALGSRFMAQRISGGADCPEDFGILVTKENLEEHIKFLRKNILESLSSDINSRQ